MKQIPIIAGSNLELQAYVAANTWINPEAVVRITKAEDLLGHHGLVLALPGWESSPSIQYQRRLMEFIMVRGMQLVVLEQAAYQLVVTQDVATNRVELPIEQWGRP